MLLKPIIIILTSLLLCFGNSYGAFCLKTAPAKLAITNVPAISKAASPKEESQQVYSKHNLSIHPHGRSQKDDLLKAAAIILNIIGLFTCICGLHRLVYGYWIIGALQLLGGGALAMGLLLLLFGSWGGVVLALLVFGGLMFLWHFSDLIRILANDLVPKWQRRPKRSRYKYRNHSYR